MSPVKQLGVGLLVVALLTAAFMALSVGLYVDTEGGSGLAAYLLAAAGAVVAWKVFRAARRSHLKGHSAPAAWYPDPEDHEQTYRYWNGALWTEHRAPRGPLQQ